MWIIFKTIINHHNRGKSNETKEICEIIKKNHNLNDLNINHYKKYKQFIK